MAKTNTYTYIALGIFVLVILLGVFVYTINAANTSADSSVKEGIRNGNFNDFTTKYKRNISGNNIVTLPIKLDKGNPIIDPSEKETKKFIKKKLKKMYLKKKKCK